MSEKLEANQVQAHHGPYTSISACKPPSLPRACFGRPWVTHRTWFPLQLTEEAVRGVQPQLFTSSVEWRTAAAPQLFFHRISALLTKRLGAQGVAVVAVGFQAKRQTSVFGDPKAGEVLK